MYHQRLKTTLQRFEEKVIKSEGCWTWIGAAKKQGYGMIYFNGRNRAAHAVSKHLYDGFPIDSNSRGLEWDHKCRNPRCVNPEHLELVSKKVNILRGESPQARNANKTHCHNGHDLSVHAMPWRLKKNGFRSCYICHKKREKKYYRKRTYKK